MGVSSCAIKQLMRQTFYFMDSVALNNILLRKDLCHWSRGLNIRHNLSQLEDWGRTHSHLIDTRALDALLPLVQAAQLLQINKKERDAAEKICGVCSDLSPLQVRYVCNFTPLRVSNAALRSRSCSPCTHQLTSSKRESRPISSEPSVSTSTFPSPTGRDRTRLLVPNIPSRS